MEEKKSFLVYLDYRQHLELLTDEEKGKLLMAMFDYAESEKLPEFEGALKMAFSFIKAQLQRDCEKYKLRCEANRENGKKGGRPKGSKQYGLGYYNGKKDAEAELAESMAKEEKDKLMLTLKEAAELTGLTYNALRLMCIREEIPYHRVGKKYLINKEILLEYLKAPH